MKHLTAIACMVLLTLFTVTGYAQKKQTNKPSLFANFPSAISCTEADLSKLFTVAKGQNIIVSLENNFKLSGPVTSNLTKYRNLQTIVIQLPEFNNTLFSLSKQTDENNNYTFVGRIINPSYADGFELTRTTNGNYQFIKIDLEKILVDCNQ